MFLSSSHDLDSTAGRQVSFFKNNLFERSVVLNYCLPMAFTAYNVYCINVKRVVTIAAYLTTYVLVYLKSRNMPRTMSGSVIIITVVLVGGMEYQF